MADYASTASHTAKRLNRCGRPRMGTGVGMLCVVPGAHGAAGSARSGNGH